MKKIKIGVIAGVIALLMALSSANTVAVAEETAEAKGNVVIEDEEWDKDAGSEPINLNDVTAKELIVESGNESVVRINGGTIDTVSVVAPKLDVIGYEEIVSLLELGMPAEDVAQMYRNYLDEKKEVNELRPTVKLAGDAVIEEMVVSAGATLNLAGGEVKEVVVNNNNNSDMLTITIQNYDGKVKVDQKTNTDGTANLITIKLKNSNLSELEVIGQESCSFFIEGNKASDVAAVTVNGAAGLTMNVPAKDVLVAEGAEKSSVRIYSDVENVVVAADNCDFVVAASAKVQNAKVDGDNVDVKYAGDIENAEVNGTGSEVSYAPVTPVPKPTKAPTPTPTPMPEGTIVGSEDCTTAFWGAHSNTYKVEAGASKTITLWNYTKEVNNWNNYYVVLQNVPDAHSAADNADYLEYAVVRADNWGWGTVNGVWTDPISGENNSSTDWATWLANMNGAKVEVTVTNHGDSADVVANITTENGKTYYQKYTNITVTGDLYFCFTVDNCYLIVEEPEDTETEDTETPDAGDTETPDTGDTETEEPATKTVIGNEEVAVGWWGDHSDTFKVEAGTSETITFQNFSQGTLNWNNFVVVLQNMADVHGTAENANYYEYAVLRADNYGWNASGNTFANYEALGWTLEHTWDWPNDETFRANLHGATVELTVKNNGDTADVVANVTSAAGGEYYQKYLNIPVDGENLYFCLTVDSCYLVLE